MKNYSCVEVGVSQLDSSFRNENENWHTVIGKTNLTKKFIEDEEGKDLLLVRMLDKKLLSFSTHGHTGSCLGYALLTARGKERQKPRKNEFRQQVPS